ncbi:MAG: ribosomal large subunit pseudouridine synthase [Myxococcaceae bacterium]|nr:ribosomal large subunit pseudouridine synthase [Myxococcaceae bacterium]
MTDLLVPPTSEGQRLDLFLGEQLKLSRAKVKSLLEADAVRLDGRRAKKGDKVAAGQKVAVRELEEAPRAATAEPSAPLVVLHVDEALVFIDKPAGMPSHPLLPGETGTVANALVARYPECVAAGLDEREGGLCHRLDTETSGVLLAARTRPAWEKMREAFSGSGADKRYLALVTGPLADEGEIELPLAHHGERVRPAAGGGSDAREAHSRFTVLRRNGEYALVEVQILTGVMHQVRAHLAAVGASIVGDGLYGGRPEPGLNRFFLHAQSLQISHPDTGEKLKVDSPLPPELAAVLHAHGL